MQALRVPLHGCKIKVMFIAVVSAIVVGLVPATAAHEWHAAARVANNHMQAPVRQNEVHKSSESFIVLTIRLRDDRASEIVRATQVDGKLIPRQLPVTNYVYEITKDGKPYVVGFLPEGTFGFRGFRDQQTGTEKTGAVRSTTISLNIPNASLDLAKDGKLGLRIYKLSPGSEESATSEEAIVKLVSKQRASIEYELSRAAVAAQVKRVTQASRAKPE